MKTKYLISCAVAALVSGAASAQAQQVAANTTTATNATTIESVVVSADRRDESVQEVPNTVQAFTGQTLQDENVLTLDSLLRYTPNITYGNNGPGQGEIIMRGLSNGFRGNQSSGTIANFPNVAIYLDDQSMQFPGRNVDIYMVDMDRVEVLEGPQGTLFGGGAEAGAVRYITNKPKLDTFEANIEGTYGFTEGGADNSAAHLMVNVPVIDGKLAIRAVIYDETQGGYIDNVASTFTRSDQDLGNAYFNIKPNGANVCPDGKAAGVSGFCTLPTSQAPAGNNNAIARKDFNPVTYQGGRVSGLYQLDDDWNFLITESVENLDAQGLSVEYPTGSDFQPLQPLQVTSFTPSYNKDFYSNTAWTVNGKVGDLKLVYTGGYTSRDIHEQMDYANYSRSAGGMYYQCVNAKAPFGNAAQPAQCYSPLGYWQDTIHSNHISNELRLSTPDDWRLRVIGGAYWEEFRIYDVMNFKYKSIPACGAANLSAALAGGPACLADVRPAAGATTNDPSIRSDDTAFGEDTQRGYDQIAFFGSADYDVIPDTLTVTGGLRWFQYRDFERGSQYGTTTGCQNVPNGQCVGGTVNIDAANDQKTYAGLKGRANITWHIDKDVMAYYTFSQGFRPGAFNRSSGGVAPINGVNQFNKPNGYGPDSLQNQEIGMKGTFLDGRLQVNLSGYLMQWNNVQFLFFNPPLLGNTTFGLNGPDYHVKGAELQAQAVVMQGLTLSGSGSYNDNTQSGSQCIVSNIASSPSFGQCITAITPKGLSTAQPFTNPFGAPGTTPAFSPKYQANAHARYDWEMDGFNPYVSAGVSYTGSMYNQPATYASGTGVTVPSTTFLRYLQPSYTTFDAAMGVSYNNWYAQLYGQNLGDSHASTFTSSAQFIKAEVPLRPRIIGLRLGANF
ncbi:MAG TPA: TonB-dependent receptor [Rhizomicrobium sp.]|nr:TonB-dependent receptor [Rhizomicrobium sp.]